MGSQIGVNNVLFASLGVIKYINDYSWCYQINVHWKEGKQIRKLSYCKENTNEETWENLTFFSKTELCG